MNSSKQKAEELIEKYYTLNSEGDTGFMTKQDAKLCAIITVNEILNVLENDVMLCKQSKREYWSNVKFELEDE